MRNVSENSEHQLLSKTFLKKEKTISFALKFTHRIMVFSKGFVCLRVPHLRFKTLHKIRFQMAFLPFFPKCVWFI